MRQTRRSTSSALTSLLLLLQKPLHHPVSTPSTLRGYAPQEASGKIANHIIPAPSEPLIIKTIAAALLILLLASTAAAENLNTLSSGPEQTMTFSTISEQKTYLNIPGTAEVTSASLQLEAHPVSHIKWERRGWNVEGACAIDCNTIRDGIRGAKSDYCSSSAPKCGLPGSVAAPETAIISWRLTVPESGKIQLKLITNGCSNAEGDIIIARDCGDEGVSIYTWSGAPKTSQETPEIDLLGLGYSIGEQFNLKLQGSGVGEIVIYDARAAYPSGVVLDIGADGDAQWEISGIFEGTINTPDISGEINEYLGAHAANSDGIIMVPVVLRSESAGRITIRNIDIEYAAVNTDIIPIPTVTPTPEPEENVTAVENSTQNNESAQNNETMMDMDLDQMADINTTPTVTPTPDITPVATPTADLVEPSSAGQTNVTHSTDMQDEQQDNEAGTDETAPTTPTTPTPTPEEGAQDEDVGDTADEDEQDGTAAENELNDTMEVDNEIIQENETEVNESTINETEDQPQSGNSTTGNESIIVEDTVNETQNAGVNGTDALDINETEDQPQSGNSTTGNESIIVEDTVNETQNAEVNETNTDVLEINETVVAADGAVETDIDMTGGSEIVEDDGAEIEDEVEDETEESAEAEEVDDEDSGDEVVIGDAEDADVEDIAEDAVVDEIQDAADDGDTGSTTATEQDSSTTVLETEGGE